MRLRARASLIAVALMLAITQSACVSVQPQATALAPARVVEKFNLSGRLSVRAAERIDSARFTWAREAAGAETLKFFTPFGSQIAELVAGAGRTTLTRGKEIETAESETELIERVLGVQLSTAEIARWVQGVGLDAAGHAPSSAWTIVAENFKLRDRVNVASRIIATRGQGADEITVRIVIDDFHAP